jgi:peptidoglycan/xylan/chitin deacetylase (PgdA/CDA1 family)
MKVPVLTYHSAQVSGDDYATNDHVALHDDLRTLHAEGFRIVPLSWVVDWVVGERPSADLSRAVALSFDDGCSLDFVDLVHPAWGLQRSFFGILQDFLDEFGPAAQPHLQATSFVIASPDTRRDLGERCLVNPQWIADSWWKAASDSGLIAIENHSWDHNHPESRRVCQREQQKGRFDLED